MDIKIVVYVALMCLACYECNRCGENEIYTTCASACEPTCTNQDPICTAQCNGTRCQCDIGYVRNAMNRCVRPCECKEKCNRCGENEIYTTCASACEPTCTNQDPICTAQCIGARCQCAKGYVRNAMNRCVLPRECKTKCNRCGENEIYTTCASACEPTCTDQDPICTAQCNGTRCQCAKGYVRNAMNRCVRPCECKESKSP